MSEIGKRDTVGALSLKLMAKDTAPTHTVIDQTRAQLDKYDENIEECVASSKKTIGDKFFVIVLTKKEKLMPNVIRNYFFGRFSCPTPNYDQVVYYYDSAGDNLKLIWVIPDKKTCTYFKSHSKEVNPSQFELLSYVLKFADGTLFKLAKSLNNEKDNSSELRNKK